MEAWEWAEALYKRILPHIRMENTRILAKGIQELCRQYRREAIESSAGWEMERLTEFVRRTYEESRSEETYLDQNLNADFFRFRDSYLAWKKGGVHAEDEWIRLAAMMRMYNVLEGLEGTGRRESALSSCYEALCGCMRDILDFNMCYLVYRYLDETRILAASAVYREDLSSMLSEKKMIAILDDFARAKQDRDDSAGAVLEQLAENALFLKRVESGGKERQLLMLPFEFSGDDKSPEEQLFLILHRDADAEGGLEELLLQVRDALFLRGQMIAVLERDYHHLMNIQQEYRNIGQRSKTPGKVRILHLSDLHVTKDNAKEMQSCIKALEQVEQLQDKDAFDFIAITGDVAQGRCSAGELEKNYECAAEVIRELAFQIWSRPALRRGGKQTRMLDQDWKKRVLIIPGNHDYASMNELETQHDETHRASAGGRPAAQEGSPMAKFTYYINFLRQLLDVNIGTLIDQGLNEFRRYDDLNVSFLLLNTSIMANPLRNNKVHLDRHFVESVGFKMERGDNNRVVCLCHHGPRYPVDYVSDQYYESCVCIELTQRFRQFVDKQLDLPERYPAKAPFSRAEMEEMWIQVEYTAEGTDDPLQNDSGQALMRENEWKRIPNDIAAQVVKQRKRSRLYGDYTTLAGEADRPPSEIDERYQRVRHMIRRAAILSEEDAQAYRKTFGLLKKERGLTVTLSGHTHKRDGTEAENGDPPQYVADRFFSKRFHYAEGAEGTSEYISRKLRQLAWLKYGVCELSDIPENNGVRYRFYAHPFSISADGEKVSYQEDLDPGAISPK